MGYASAHDGGGSLPGVRFAIDGIGRTLSSAAPPKLVGGAMDFSHPNGGFRTFTSSGRVDQNQAMTASIGTMREPILVLHDEVKGLSQRIGVVSISEAYAAWMGRRSPRPVIAHQILFTPRPDRPDAQGVQGDSRFTYIFNPY